MDKTQLVSIELTTECNLGDVHTKCPNRHPDRYRYVNTSRPLTDKLIIDTIVRLYHDFDFDGMIGGHYYCEPLCVAPRFFRIMAAVRERAPQAKFLLWTNGTLLEQDLRQYDKFDGIVITYYGKGDHRRMQMLSREHRQAVVVQWPLDGRLSIEGPERNIACTRPFCEMPIDYYGNVHACCYAWRGGIRLGNLWDQPLEMIVRNWRQFRDSIAGPVMEADAPYVCRSCKMRPPVRRSRSLITRILPQSTFAPEAADRAEEYVTGLRRARMACGGRRVAVVFVSYLKVPESRLQEHFVWNGSLYEEAGVRVYVVSDREYELPAYARTVLFPRGRLPKLDGKRVFSLCATKNVGLRRALADGAQVIICMDVDTCLPPEMWNHLVSVRDSEAKVPMVAMVPRSLVRESAKYDKGVTNTIAMTARNWMRIQYNEACIGYGADDGIIVRDIKHAKLDVDRSGEVWHIDHPGEEGAVNMPGRGRTHCYGRVDGFNPDNFEANRKICLTRASRRVR